MKSLGIKALFPDNGGTGAAQHIFIIGDEFPTASVFAHRSQAESLALTLADTSPMSARPARRGLSAAMTLPIAALPPAPASAIEASLSASISALVGGCGMH